MSRRDEILLTAAALFAESGYAGVGIDDIGAALSMSGPALYWHFHAKEEILAEILDTVGERLLVAGIACVADGGPPGDLLRGLLRAHAQTALSIRDFTSVYLRERPPPGEAARSYQRTHALYLELWVTVLARSGADTGTATDQIIPVIDPLLDSMTLEVLSSIGRGSAELTDLACAATEAGLLAYLARLEVGAR